jgi:hypothetical protein
MASLIVNHAIMQTEEIKARQSDKRATDLFYGLLKFLHWGHVM